MADKGDADQVVFDAIDGLFPEHWAGAYAARLAGAALRAKADEIDPPDDDA